jgi:hypothetical protein
MEVIELLLNIKPSIDIYYHKDTKEFSYNPCSDIQLNILKQKGPEEFCKLFVDKNNDHICLPRYEDLHHNEIMREFVKEFVEEKETRKSLFGILSRRDYIDGFIQALKDFDLYDMFKEIYSEYYDNIFQMWLDYHGIKLSEFTK